MPVGPQQGAAQSVHHSLETLLDSLGLITGCIFCVISAAPLMRDFCSGQDLGAPYGSLSFLRLYPCEGSVVAQASFLVQYSPQILKSLLSIRGPDVWLAGFLSFWLLRLASRICLPQQMYFQLAAPLLRFAARAASVVLLLASARKAPLSSAASKFVFRSQGFFDAIVSVTQPTSCALSELIFDVLSMAAVGFLAASYGRGGGGGGGGGGASRSFVVQVVIQRAALMAAVHWLVGHFLLRRRHRRRRRDGDDSSDRRVDSSARRIAGLSQPARNRSPPPPMPPAAQQPRQPQQQQQQDQQRQQEGKVADSVPAAARDQQDPAEKGELCGSCAGGSKCTGPDLGCQMLQRIQARIAAKAAATATVTAGIDAAAMATAAAAGMDAAAAVAAGAEGAAPRGPVLLPYRSPIRRHTARIKIPFAEPEQIAPGHVERLQALVAERGMHLSGVYVRRGCIELLLDLEAEAEWLYNGTAYGTAMGTAATRDGRARTWQGSRDADGGCHACGCGDNGAGVVHPGHTNLVTDLSSDVDGLLRALGITANPAVHVDKQVTSDVRVSAVQLGGAVRADVASVASRRRRPVIVALSPRVLLTPSLPLSAPSDSISADAVVLSVVVSYPDDGAANSTPALPPLPEVLIRSQGAYLRIKMVHQSGGGSGGVNTLSYDVELLELPPRPGVLLIEFRWGAVLSNAVPVLVLNDAAVAAELQSAAAAGMLAGAGIDGDCAACAAVSYDHSVDGLLLDLGAWLAHSSASAASGTAATVLPPPPPLPYMPDRVAQALAMHLLDYAEACGLTATARSIKRDLQLRAARGGATARAAVTAGAAGGSRALLPPPPVPALPSGPLLLTALLQALGWTVLPPKEEAAYQAYATPRVLSYSHVIQAVEVCSLFALLFRARQQLLDPGNLTSLAGCAVGTLTAVMWPLLPRRRWEGLVNATKVPRYLAYMTAKLMIGGLGFPAPPGIVPYQLGSAMVVMEGVLLPFSCLLSPGAALVLALIKLPFGVGMMLRSGATSDPVRAVVLCLRIVLAAVATTIACHTYLRASYAAWVAAPAAAAAHGAAVARGFTSVVKHPALQTDTSGTASSAASSKGKVKAGTGRSRTLIRARVSRFS